MKNDLRIIFMGTPDFAVDSLRILHKNGYNIVGVITATDKFGGRGGKKIMQSEVKKAAVELGLNILQPTNLKSKSFVEDLKHLQANLQIVVAFRMLPKIVWDMPHFGTYNLHGSLLPKYRGAAPIHWAVINGETETGVTSFKLQHKIDTGDLLFQEKIKIDPADNTGMIYNKLKTLGAGVVLKTVKAIEKNEVTLHTQKETLVSHAPKLNRFNCKIDFMKTSKEVYNQIRGLNPFPLAWTHLMHKETKIIEAKISDKKFNYFPGTLVTDNKSYINYCTTDGSIEVLKLKVEGKKAMDAKDFLNGSQLLI